MTQAYSGLDDHISYIPSIGQAMMYSLNIKDFLNEFDESETICETNFAQ